MGKFLRSSFVFTVSALFSTAAHAVQVRDVQVHKAAATTVRMSVDVEPATTSSVDVLFVVDDSGSMYEYQEKMKKSIDELIRTTKASGVDVHAAVITTSANALGGIALAGSKGEFAGPNKKVATTTDGDFDIVLKENLETALTLNGDSTEMPFEAIRLALSEPLVSTTNKDFLREGAALAIFVLTDADDQSSMTVADFATFLRTVKGTAPLSFQAAYSPTGAGCIGAQGQPVRMETLLAELGSKTSFPICDDMGPHLAAVGLGLGMLGVRTVQLNVEPKLTTMKVTYGTEAFVAGDLLYGWSYDSATKQILLGEKIDWSTQPAGTKLLIEYEAK